MNLRLLSVLPLVFGLSSCLIESNQPKPYSTTKLLGLVEEGPARYLNKATFESLPAEQQYQVANKLLGTLYKGITVREFFDMSAGMTNPRAKGVDVIGNTMNALLEPMDGKEFNAVSQKIEKDFLPAVTDDEDRIADRAFGSTMAYLYGLPLSKDHFSRWIAHQLVNSILFSPAVELDSADPIDAQTIYNRLVLGINADRPISDLIYEHMISQENWRRFRSPEDNVREMAEIYLLRFRDNEVPRAAKACKNWWLTDGDGNDRYRLVIDSNENREPQPDVLDTNSIVTCYDFYKRIATHPAMIPTIAARVVDQMMPDHTTEQRAAMVNSIVATHPTRFDQIFAAVVFSEEYLLHTSRIKTFEETFFNLSSRTTYQPERNTFTNLTTSTDTGNMSAMNQATMKYKLGRILKTPTDTLSFANYFVGVRSQIVSTADANGKGKGWRRELVRGADIKAMTPPEYINYIFLTSAGRVASDDETQTFRNVCGLANATNLSKTSENQLIGCANVIFDYATRLSTTYVY